jgi:hypothetical protein
LKVASAIFFSLSEMCYSNYYYYSDGLQSGSENCAL